MNAIASAALEWAANQIDEEMRHWPPGPSRDAMERVRDRILEPHPQIKHQLDMAVLAAIKKA